LSGAPQGKVAHEGAILKVGFDSDSACRCSA
jgi:hypothetical protein